MISVPFSPWRHSRSLPLASSYLLLSLGAVVLLDGDSMFSPTLKAQTPLSQPGQDPIAEASSEPSGHYLRSWLLCGPFPALTQTESDIETIRLPGMYTDYLKGIGGESQVRPSAGQEVAFPGGICRWTSWLSSSNAVDLDAALSRSNAVVGYAYGEVQSPRAQACILALGSNDGARVWVNGEAVLDCPGPRGLQLDHNLVPIALRAGANTLLVKVEERGNRWGFACRLLPLTGEFLAERLRLFDLRTRDDGSAVVRARQTPGLTAALLQSATFEASSIAAPDVVAWRGHWSGGTELTIGVDTRHFAPYQLRIRTQLAGGHEQHLTLPFHAGRRMEHVLFEKGQSDYRILLDADASDSEQWAAQELQRWVREVGGVTLAMDKGDGLTAGERIIAVGWGRRLQQLLGPNVAAPKDDQEAFTIRSVGPAIAIWGGRQRGTMYGVHSFLERELGVRFYTPRVTVAPQKTRYAFTALQHSETPGVRVRNDFYYEAFDSTWAARNRINGAMSTRPQPGGVEAYWSVHTFYPLMPPEEFFGQHPEYYSLLGGTRTAERAQLCLSNPDVLRILTERLRRKMRELPDYLIYDVSQNDWSNPCECADCQALVDREGSQSGPIIEFVNRVADAIRPEFPGKFVGTLAYQYTRKPPRTLKPRDNVVVRFCSIECCFAHDFISCPENRDFVDDMNGWAAIAPHIYIWDYVVNFSHYLLPYPNFRVLQPNIRFFRDHRAIGIMEQAAYQSRGGEFAELRSYLLAKLLWNPDAEVELILNDFMHGYYGRAGQYVRAYFDLLHGRLGPDTHIHLGLQHDDRLFSEAFVQQAESLFDQAERVADTEEIRQRVEMARLPILYLKCKRTPAMAKQDTTYARFRKIVEREGISYYAEAGEPHRKAFHAEVEAAE